MRRTAAIGGVVAGALVLGAGTAGGRAVYEAARLAPSHPDYFAWEACAEYLPRWLSPFMRACVEEIRAAQTGEPAPEDVGMARFLICSYGMAPVPRSPPTAGDMRSAGIPLAR